MSGRSPPQSAKWADSLREVLLGRTATLFRAASLGQRGQRLRFWSLAMCLAVPLGIYQGWLSLFYLTLKVSQSGSQAVRQSGSQAGSQAVGQSGSQAGRQGRKASFVSFLA